MQILRFSVVGLITFILGAVISALVITFTVPNMLIVEKLSPYDYDKTISVVKHQITQQQGYTLENVLAPDPNMTHIEFSPISVGSQLQEADKKFAPLLSQTITIYEQNDGKVYIAFTNSAMVGKLLNGEVQTVLKKLYQATKQITTFAH
jgi:uncharacterized protein (DUF302 family)